MHQIDRQPAATPPVTSTSAAAPDPATVAARIIADNTVRGQRDLGAIRREVDAITTGDATLGRQVLVEVERLLTPVERGQLARASYIVPAPDGQTIAFAPNAPSVGDYYAMPTGTPGKTFYARLDRLWGDGNAATNDVTRIEAGLAELYRSGTTVAEYEARTALPPSAPATSPGSLATTALDLGQIALDIVGIFEPTPFADGTNTLVSLGRGNFLDAGLSGLGIIPYLGDAAKLGKLGGWANKVANAIELAANNPAARAALEPAIRRIGDALAAIPQGALDALPASARDTLVTLKKKVDDFLALAGRSFDSRITAAAERLGISPARIDEIVGAGRGARPSPDTYLSPARIADHARAFENGGSRFTLQGTIDKYGLGQRDGTTFIMTRGEADDIVRAAAGDPRKLEIALGLPVGQLDNGTLVRVDFNADAMTDLNMRVPSGNEAGANDQWLPGGYLPNGQQEAVIDGALTRPEHYTTTRLN